MQALAEVHDTADKRLVVAPTGLGVAWIVQRVPFQCSARVPSVPALLACEPVAVHALAAEHDTPVSPLVTAPTGLGVA